MIMINVLTIMNYKLFDIDAKWNEKLTLFGEFISFIVDALGRVPQYV